MKKKMDSFIFQVPEFKTPLFLDYLNSYSSNDLVKNGFTDLFLNSLIEEEKKVMINKNIFFIVDISIVKEE